MISVDFGHFLSFYMDFNDSSAINMVNRDLLSYESVCSIITIFLQTYSDVCMKLLNLKKCNRG